MIPIPNVEAWFQNTIIDEAVHVDNDLILSGHSGIGHWYENGSLLDECAINQFELVCGWGENSYLVDLNVPIVKEWAASKTPVDVVMLHNCMVMTDHVRTIVLPKTKRAEYPTG